MSDNRAYQRFIGRKETMQDQPPNQGGQKLLPLTPKDIEGPFYKPHAMLTSDMAAPLPTEFVIKGQLLDQKGQPVVMAVIDFWCADKNGDYDMVGLKHRTKVMTDHQGEYKVRAIRPGDYKISDPGQPEDFRCAHIHVKVWVGGKEVLTTQLYFPDDKYNATDHWFNPEMVLHVNDKEAEFNFVVKV